MWTLLGNMEWTPLPGTLRERGIFRGWDVEGSVDGCLRIVPFREPGDGVHLEGNVRDSGERALEMEHLSFTVALSGEPRSVKECSGYGHLFPWGSHWETLDRFQLGRLESAHIPGILRDG
jgi:hypothetical protein